MDNRDLYNAIWKRKSVRKYLDTHIEKSKMDFLNHIISDLNAKSGLTIEFIEVNSAFNTAKSLGIFKNVRSILVFKGKTDDPNLCEKCGYYGEHVILAATDLGLGTCWVAGMMSLVMFNKKSIDIKDDERIVCVSPIGYSVEGMSESTGIPEKPHRKTISAAEFLNGNTEVPEWVSVGIKAVQFAPTAMNSQKSRFTYDGKDLTIAIPPKSDLNMVDLGITKCHFELAAEGKFELGSPSKFIRSS